jgi:hypothetical protein
MRSSYQTRQPSAVGHEILGQSLLAAGRLEAGPEQLYRARGLSGGMVFAGPIAAGLLLSGQVDEARSEVAVVPDGPEWGKGLVLLNDGPQSQAAHARLEGHDSVPGLLNLAETTAFRGDRSLAFQQLGQLVSRLYSQGPGGSWLGGQFGPRRFAPKWPQQRHDARGVKHARLAAWSTRAVSRRIGQCRPTHGGSQEIPFERRVIGRSRNGSLNQHRRRGGVLE